MKYLLSIIFSFSLLISYSQITVDLSSPYDAPSFLIDDVLLGGGIIASNHLYQGDSVQIGFFDATNTSLGIDNGIVMATGEVGVLDPAFVSTFPLIPNTVTDPDLLNVANSVPPLLPAPHTNSFTVSSVNDIAVLEFDFVPTSDSLSFRYVFGSQEYFAFENSQYNDVFGFFLSGPGITGPYSSPAFHPNGSVNLAIVPGSNPPLPITISSVNSVTPINSQYFVDNQAGLDTISVASGYTTVLTAYAAVQCGETYHIRLAIADGSDSGLSSFVWLEAGSFSSPVLEVVDDLGLDSTVLEIPCNSNITLTANGGVGATYEWYDDSGNVFSTNNNVTVGSGLYWVTATSFGCPVISDSITVVSQSAPEVLLLNQYSVACNATINLDPIVTGGSGNYTYDWSNNSADSSIIVGGGTFGVVVTDNQTSCYGGDTTIVVESLPPDASILGGGSICNNGSTVQINFTYNGLIPWDLEFINESDTFFENNIQTQSYNYITSQAGTYEIISIVDVNDCIANFSGTAIVEVNQNPTAILNWDDYLLYIGDTLFLQLSEDYSIYEWYDQNDELISNNSILSVYQAGEYYVYVVDENGCSDQSDLSIINVVPRSELYVPNTFTPNSDRHNELFIVHAQNIRSFNMKIFDRWGDVLFQSDDIEKHWDGTFNGNKVEQDKYLYVIDIVGEDNVPFTKSGIINLLY
ncbi:choice-of-anchor L domain-containing protein [Flavobacteriales bacterium]|nr:choice-of-anchor L domain-containing protein [Flavobacteriales bacterium]